MRNPFKRQRSFYAMKQDLAHPSRYYGNGGTIYSTGYLQVESHENEVVAVWFRCQMIPFKQVEVDAERAAEMRHAHPIGTQLTGVEVLDPQ